MATEEGVGAVRESEATRGQIPSALGRWLLGLELGAPCTAGRLEVVPLISKRDEGAPYLLLHEAMGRGLLQVSEQRDGVVNEVLATNLGSDPLLVVEGETILGAKQNRVVLMSMIIPGHTTVPVPVGCMEQGRWTIGSQFSGVGEMPIEPEIRSQSMFERVKGGRFDQGRLWGTIAAKLSAAQVHSRTADYNEFMASHHKAAKERARALEPVPGQVGIMALLNGKLVALELLGHPVNWASIAARLTSSYMLGLFGDAARGTTGRLTAQDWLELIAKGSVISRHGVGQGEQIILQGPGYAGAGVWDGHRPAHLAVFAR